MLIDSIKTFSMQPVALAQRAAAYDLADDEVRAAAERAAASVRRLAASAWLQLGPRDELVLKTLHRMAQGYGVRHPNKAGAQQWFNRMTDPAWWRRALRSRFRDVELHQIRKGAVHCQAGRYVSDKAMCRFERNKTYMAGLLSSLDLVNQTTGEVLPLQEVVDASLANPSNRRKAMMARIKGIEATAKARGHEALFLTITCPSRMHPRHYSTGAANEAYEGASPRQAQAYLGRLWNNAMRVLAHQGITPYGLRVVEPHHDACPHWHVLAFLPAQQVEAFTSVMRAYALADSPNEPGAQERRFTVERIDPEKGSAVGYVAKYVSKSIDGEGVDQDDESDMTGKDASHRIVAWARTWGVRQFQFFGVPSITPTRELYRLDAECLPSAGLKAAHEAAKANDYAAWLQACQVHGLRFRVAYSERPSGRYADEITRSITGLKVQGEDLAGVLELVTRQDAWRIAPRKQERPHGDAAAPGLSHPWTRFNNSASVDFKGIFSDPDDGQQTPAKRLAKPVHHDTKTRAWMASAQALEAAGYGASAAELRQRAWLRMDALAMKGRAA